SNGPVFFEEGGGRARVEGRAGPLLPGGSQVHVVRKGDTLWGICDSYFHNPYQWPRIWSYNPQIQNPHCVFPNENVRLKPGGKPGGAVEAQQASQVPQQPQEGANAPGAIIDRRHTVPPETIFLRDTGFIEDDATSNWGSITGAPVDKMFLTDF